VLHRLFKRAAKRVALTFDTEHPELPCPPGVEDILLETLARAEVRATFFLQGRWVRSSPATARGIAEAGHVIGNHSHYHAPVDGLTGEAMRHDVRQAEEAIRTVTGVDPRPWFRCPFGSGMHDPRVLEQLEELGYRHVGWDVDPRDWEERRDPGELTKAVIDGTRRRRGDTIVLMHGWPAVTAEALAGLIDGLTAAGAEFVSVGELTSVEGSARVPSVLQAQA